MLQGVAGNKLHYKNCARKKNEWRKNSKQLKVREEAAKLCQVAGRACEKVFQTHKKAPTTNRESERDRV